MKSGNSMARAFLVGLAILPLGAACGYWFANISLKQESIPMEVAAWDAQHNNRLGITQGDVPIARTPCETVKVLGWHRFAANGQTIELPATHVVYAPAKCRV